MGVEHGDGNRSQYHSSDSDTNETNRLLREVIAVLRSIQNCSTVAQGFRDLSRMRKVADDFQADRVEARAMAKPVIPPNRKKTQKIANRK